MLEVTNFQNRLLTIPARASIFAGGGKGGGKSHGLMLLAVQHCEQYGEKAHCLIVRRTFKGAEELRHIGLRILKDKYNADPRKFWTGSPTNTFTLKGEGRIEIGYLEHPDDLIRYSGHSYSFIGFDEVADLEPSLFEALRAEIRAAPDVITRIAATANPGKTFHDYYKRQFADHEPWKPFREADTDIVWVHAPSTIKDNPLVDANQAIANIVKLDHSEALITGDWNAVRSGAYFLGAYSEERSVIDDWPRLPEHGWRYELYIDHAGTSVTACIFTATALEATQCPNGTYFPKNSVVVLADYDDSKGRETGNWNASYALGIAKNCEAIDKTAERLGMRSVGKIDVQVTQDHGDDHRLIDLYHSHGIMVEPWARHTRENASSIVREYFHGAHQPRERELPGLYFCKTAEGCIATIPTLPRDRNNPNAPATKGVPDHHFDCVKALCFERYQPISITEFGRHAA